MKFFLRTSAGSNPKSLATKSNVLSKQNADSGPPVPRKAPVGVLLVTAATSSTLTAGMT